MRIGLSALAAGRQPNRLLPQGAKGSAPHPQPLFRAQREPVGLSALAAGRQPNPHWGGGEGILDLLHQGLQLARAPRALRWRLETFGLYMPSLPDTRPWWRVNRRALTAFVGQLPRYAHWLTTMRALRHDGAAGYWRVEAATSLRAWEEWLNLSNQ